MFGGGFQCLTKIAALATSGLILSGCATITRGTSVEIKLNSEPPGAEARTSLGHYCAATPCAFDVSRKAEFVVTFAKPGFEPQQTSVTTRVASAGVTGMVGNVVAGGVVGVGVDAATGATLEHVPNPIFVTLLPAQKKQVNGTKPAREPVS
ncbi:MAG: translation initiation factor 2 [Bosea sp. (in: a-proteobacteria)]